MRTPFFDRFGDDHVRCARCGPLHNRLAHSPGSRTSTEEPDLTSAVLRAAPTPVCTAQPITRDVEWRVVGNLDGATRRNHGVFSKGADAESAVHEIAVQAERRCPVWTKVVNKGESLSALRARMTSARTAFPAGCERGENHLVADPEMFDPCADVRDLTCRFVPQHHRHAVSGIDHRQIGVTDPAVEHPYEHLARPRRLDVEVVDDLQRAIRGSENSSTHVLTLGGRAEVAQNPGCDPMSGVGGRDGIGTRAT